MTPRLRVERLERLLAMAAEAQAGAVLLTRPEHIYYLTEVEPPADNPASLLASRDGLRAVWPDSIPAELPSEIDAIPYPLHSARSGGRPDDFAPTCRRHLALGADTELLVDAELAPLGFAHARDG